LLIYHGLRRSDYFALQQYLVSTKTSRRKTEGMKNLRGHARLFMVAWDCSIAPADQVPDTFDTFEAPLEKWVEKGCPRPECHSPPRILRRQAPSIGRLPLCMFSGGKRTTRAAGDVKTIHRIGSCPRRKDQSLLTCGTETAPRAGCGALPNSWAACECWARNRPSKRAVTDAT